MEIILRIIMMSIEEGWRWGWYVVGGIEILLWVRHVSVRSELRSRNIEEVRVI